MDAEAQAVIRKLAEPRQDPPPALSPLARVPQHLGSAHTEFDATTPINPADMPALLLSATFSFAIEAGHPTDAGTRWP